MSAEPLTEPLGRPILGPSAIGGDWRRFWHLTVTIAKNEFRLRFFGSSLGYVWQLMRPLLLFGVLYVVFTNLFHAGAIAKHFPAILLSDVVMFTFFSEATSSAVRSVVDREALVRKIQFPRLAIPLSVVLTALFNLCLNLIAVGVFIVAAQGITPTVRWLEIPVILLVLAVFATGIAMLLSALYVRLRDIQPIWDVLAQILFYASPVLYTIQTVKQKIGASGLHAYMINPLATIFEQFRHAVIDPSAPSAGQALGSWTALLEPLAIVGFVFVLGFWVFNRQAPQIAEDL